MRNPTRKDAPGPRSHSRLVDSFVFRLARFVDTVKRSRPGGVAIRYSSRHGSLLSNGLAFGLLFAFFAGVWVVVSVLGLLVTGSEGIRATLVSSLEKVVPGIGQGVLTSSLLSGASVTFTWTGIVTLVMFWWTIVGWMDSFRGAVRTMFDMTDDTDLVKDKLRDNLAVFLVAVLLILSMTAAAVSAGAVRGILGFLGLPMRSDAVSIAVDLVGGLVGLAVNVGLFMVLFRVVAKVRMDRHLIWGCVAGGVGMSVMQLLGTRLLAGASRNPLLAPFAALIGVLIWFNLVSQLMLVAAAAIAEAQSGDAVEE